MRNNYQKNNNQKSFDELMKDFKKQSKDKQRDIGKRKNRKAGIRVKRKIKKKDERDE